MPSISIHLRELKVFNVQHYEEPNVSKFRAQYLLWDGFTCSKIKLSGAGEFFDNFLARVHSGRHANKITCPLTGLVHND